MPDWNAIAQRLEAATGLRYLADAGSGNVCYAADKDLRPEYRQYFSIEQLKTYVAAWFPSGCYVPEKAEMIPLPVSAADFWNKIEGL